MKNMQRSCQLLLTLVTLTAQTVAAVDMGAAFTYHGRLTQSGCAQPVRNGLYDFRFYLYDNAAAGTLQAETAQTLPVTNGLFTTSLDFGPAVFGGQARWLELEVRNNALAEPFVRLSPRQELKPTPYALYAAQVGTALSAASVPWSGIPDIPTDIADGDQDTTYSAGAGLVLAGTVFSAQFAGSGLADTVAHSDHDHAGAYEPAGTLHDDRYWKLHGNATTDPALNFLGTTDDQPLNLRANDRRVLRVEFPTPHLSPNLIGGHAANRTSADVSGATIGGGGLADAPNVVDADFATIPGGAANQIHPLSEHGTVGGGSWNVIRSNSPNATIGGGNVNAIDPGSAYATIDGGHANWVQYASVSAVIGGGISNLIQYAASATIGGGQNNNVLEGSHATVGGGVLNRVDAGTGSTIAGGQDNQINWSFPGALPVDHAAIGGGLGNLIGSEADSATIGGGAQNRVLDRSPYATIGGGQNNLIWTNLPWAAIGGGANNVINPHADAATIAGGQANAIWDSATNATIAGGTGNRVGIATLAGAIGGGAGNLLQSRATCASIAGGAENHIGSLAAFAAIGGGASNCIADMALGAVIAGGSFNTNAGFQDTVSNRLAHSTISGGLENIIQTNAIYATIAGGRHNAIRTNACDATVSGGFANRIDPNAIAATISGGTANHVYTAATHGTIGGGQGNAIYTNTLSGTVGGGSWNRIETNAAYATIAGGKEAVARNYGQMAYASGGFSSYPGGDAQSSVFVLRNTQTTGAGELFLDGYNRRMTIPQHATWTFDALVVARSRTGVSAGWQIRGVVENDAGMATFVGTPTTDLLGPVPAPWVVTVNVVDDALVLTTLAFNDRPVRWVATVRTVETIYKP